MVKPLDRTINQLPRQLRDKIREIVRDLDDVTAGNKVVDILDEPISTFNPKDFIDSNERLTNQVLSEYKNTIRDLELKLVSGLYNISSEKKDKLEFVWHTSDFTLTMASLEKVHVFNSASDLKCYLPSVSAGNVGKWVIIAKYGSGDLTIYAADSDTILDSDPGGTIECTDNNYEYQRMGLRLATSTEWHSGPECFGIWSTR